MKHIKTFENFVSETNKSVNEKEEMYTAYIDDKRKTGGTDAEIKKDYNLVVKNRTSSGFDIVGKKEDVEAFIADYGIVLDGEIELSEGNKLDYWTQYSDNTENSIGQPAPAWMSKPCKTMSEVIKCVDSAIKDWNGTSEDGPISKSAEQHIGDLAIQYYKQFKTINGNIITAMIMQES